MFENKFIFSDKLFLDNKNKSHIILIPSGYGKNPFEMPYFWWNIGIQQITSLEEQMGEITRL